MARKIAIQSVSAGYSGPAEGHVATEIWSDELSKWIFFDSQYGIFFKDSRGKPLSFFELFKQVEKDSWKSIEPTVVVSEGKEQVFSEYRDFIVNYFGYLNFRMGDRLYSLGLKASEAILTFQGMPAKFKHFTKDVSFAHPKMNRVQITLNFDYKQPDYSKLYDSLKGLKWGEMKKKFSKKVGKFAAKPIFTTSTEHNIPYFSHYLYRINSGEWKVSKNGVIKWNGSDGKNTLDIKGVNQFGRVGAITSYSFDYS